MSEGIGKGEGLGEEEKGFMNTPFTRHNDVNSLSEGGQGIQKFPAPRAIVAANVGGRGGTPREPQKAPFWRTKIAVFKAQK